jgi:hypothetical protein
LDREHLQRVAAIRAVAERETLLLEVEAKGDLLLELWALDRKGDLFQSAFDKKPQLVRRDAVA